MITELVSRVFAIRDCAHLAHWSTSSYSEHQALGAFYDSVVESLDAIIEAHQGVSGLIKDIKLQHYDKPIIECLREDLLWVNEHADKLAQNISPIRNMLDDLMALYMTTIYKLENLK